MPTSPHPEFAGKTGNGDWADCLAELDHRTGQILDAIQEAGTADNTVVIFASDNGPEATHPWEGDSGPWRGTYFTAMEASLRAPFIVRWPGRVPAGSISNEIVHIVDLYPTLARLGGAEVPKDRPIDGVDQSSFFTGKTERSGREGILIWCADRLQAVKWRNFKVHFYQQETMVSPPIKLGIPLLFNLYTNPREDADKVITDSWIFGPVLKMVGDFEASVKKYPLIAMGTPDPYVPPR
jgi:arylsulfatase